MPDPCREVLEINANLRRLRTMLVDLTLYHRLPDASRLEFNDSIHRLDALERQLHADRRNRVCIACQFEFEGDGNLCRPCIEREMREDPIKEARNGNSIAR